MGWKEHFWCGRAGKEKLGALAEVSFCSLQVITYDIKYGGEEKI